MALSYGFFDGKYVSGGFDRLYASGQMSEMFDGVITDGVYLNWEAGLLTVTKTEGSSMGLTVSPGKAWFNGTWTINDSNLYLTVDTGEEDRSVAVVLEINKTQEVRNARIIVIDAESADDLVRTDNVNQYALAYISVDGGESAEIHDYDIVNVVGTDETPFFAWILQDLSVSDTLNKWSDILGRTTIEFVTWFSVMQAILGYDDQAYNVLYNFILQTEDNAYISRVLPRVDEFLWTITATGAKTYTIQANYVHIGNVRVNGKFFPYSVDETTKKITFVDAPVSGATISVSLIPELDLYSLYFEEPQGG
jgi:hypothetical protein